MFLPEQLENKHAYEQLPESAPQVELQRTLSDKGTLDDREFPSTVGNVCDGESNRDSFESRGFKLVFDPENKILDCTNIVQMVLGVSLVIFSIVPYRHTTGVVVGIFSFLVPSIYYLQRIDVGDFLNGKIKIYLEFRRNYKYIRWFLLSLRYLLLLVTLALLIIKFSLFNQNAACPMRGKVFPNDEKLTDHCCEGNNEKCVRVVSTNSSWNNDDPKIQIPIEVNLTTEEACEKTSLFGKFQVVNVDCNHPSQHYLLVAPITGFPVDVYTKFTEDATCIIEVHLERRESWPDVKLLQKRVEEYFSFMLSGNG